MKKQKPDSSTISTYRALKKIRNDFGNINPVTKIINNRKHDYKYPDSYYNYDLDSMNENEEQWNYK